MIRYTLVCEDGHAFEAWFPSSDSYDAQAARGLVACPSCGSTHVAKGMMAPAVSKRTDRAGTSEARSLEARASEAGTAAKETAATATDVAPGPSAIPASGAVPMIAEPERQLRALLRAVRAHVTATADDVGGRFPEEARRMHYGETESRPIYGEASPAEARALVEEGIAVAPLPRLPDDLN